MNETITEKRHFPRIIAAFPIKIGPEFLGETVDLSERGIGLVLERPLPISSSFTIH